MAAFRGISGWIAEPPSLQPALVGDCTAGVAVVGAGYTGLSTALALRNEGMDVVLIERDFAGYGASGRNAGHATPTIGKDLPSLITFFGMERARALLQFAEASVERLESLIAEHGIACDYERTGNLIAAVHPSQEKKLRNAADAAATLGAHLAFLDSAALRDRGVPPAFHCAVMESRGGTLDPGKYVLGLRRAVIDAGVRLYEQTAVTGIVDGSKIRIETPNGTVSADRAVIATNAFTRSTGRLKRAQLPLTVTLMTTAPLTPAQKARIGWAGREGVYTAHQILENHRWTADDRIMVGSKTVRLAYGGRFAPADYEPTAELLARTFRQRYPELADVDMAYYWSGYIAMPLDFLPKFGVTGKHKNLYYALGYAGHGLAQGSMAGTVIADRMAGRESVAGALVDRFIIPVPPEPLTWLYGKGLAGFLGALDRRLDAKAVRERTRR